VENTLTGAPQLAMGYNPTNKPDSGFTPWQNVGPRHSLKPQPESLANTEA